MVMVNGFNNCSSVGLPCNCCGIGSLSGPTNGLIGASNLLQLREGVLLAGRPQAPKTRYRDPIPCSTSCSTILVTSKLETAIGGYGVIRSSSKGL